MARKTPVKHLTDQKPSNPDKKAIVTLLRSIGYKVLGTEEFFGCDYIHVKFDAINPKYYGCAKRKIESRLPLKARGCFDQYYKRNGREIWITRFAVSMDRSRSFDGINDLLSTYP